MKNLYITMYKLMAPTIVENSYFIKILNTILCIELDALCLGNWIFCSKKLSKVTRNHESIHCAQYRETLYIGFILIYIFEYLKNRVAGLDSQEAYENIRFEREAYSNEKNYNYLNKRKKYAWIEYIN